MSMHIKSPTGTPDIPIHSVHVKCDYPVEFLKSIKSVGNSIIPTDIVPSYDWIAAVDLLMGSVIQATEGHSSYVFGAMKNVGGTSVGYYGFTAARDARIFYFTQGNNWDTTPALEFYEADARNTLYMRRGNADTTFGARNVTNATTANATNLTAASIAFCGVTSNSDGVISHQPNASREITIYGARLYNAGGTLIHNLVPAQSKATGRGGLYDIITGTFYPSSTDFDDVVKEAL